MGKVLFQSTPPHGGRPDQAMDRYQRALSFNPRPRTEGDTGYWSTTRSSDGGFNPRPRTEGDPKV